MFFNVLIDSICLFSFYNINLSLFLIDWSRALDLCYHVLIWLDSFISIYTICFCLFWLIEDVLVLLSLDSFNFHFSQCVFVCFWSIEVVLLLFFLCVNYLIDLIRLSQFTLYHFVFVFVFEFWLI